MDTVIIKDKYKGQAIEEIIKFYSNAVLEDTSYIMLV